jgi:predicted component of viral defense system (DUF524 family)
MFKDGDRKIILTESPYLFVNEKLRNILNEIRNIIRNDLLSVSDKMNIPATKLALGMTTFSTDTQNTHFFEVDVYKVRELQDALLER